MAKKATRSSKKSVSKSQAIRDHMSKRPDDGPNAVAAALAKDGVKVSPAFVSTVKSMDKKRAQRRSGDSGELSVERLMQAKKLALEMGGVEQARAALDALAELTG